MVYTTHPERKKERVSDEGNSHCTQVGGPEVLQFEDCPSPTPGRGEALIDIQAVGVNFADIYFRSGVFPPSSLPMIPGFEAAGVVSAVGEGVTQVKAGDVVAYTMVPNSYAQQVVAPEDMLVKMPEGLDARTGAAVILQGLTAHYLAHTSIPSRRGSLSWSTLGQAA